MSLAGLRFARDSWEAIANLKANTKVRTFADAFKAYLTDQAPDDEGILLDALSDAADAAEAQRQFAGFFSATSRTMSVAGFIPGVGAVTGGIGIAADIMSARAKAKVPDLAWHEFGPELMKAQSLERLQAAIARGKAERL